MKILLRLAALAAALALPSASRAAETVLVQEGSSMVYRANTADPGIGTTWTAEAFTPSGWSSGSYGVGYETGAAPNATALIATSVSTSSQSVYTRTTFPIADVGAVNNVFLGVDYDDGYVAWINGVEVHRANMPAGAPTWSTDAPGNHESSNDSDPSYSPFQNITAAALPALHNGTNVLAIGVWNVGGSSSDLVLVPRLSVNRLVTRGPYLQLGTPGSVTVRWRTPSAEDSCVRYGTSVGSLTQIACDPTSTTEHIVNVTGLTADTRYYYSVGTSTTALEGGTSDYFFTTSPETGSGRATRIWVLGDSGTADANARAVRDAYDSYASGTTTDLWLMLGDNAYQSGTDSEFQAGVFDTYPQMLRHSVLWPTLGNHDGITADSATQSGPYYDIFSLPTSGQAGGVASGTEAYYSFDYGDIHFICLESYETNRLDGGAMLTWLEADLADTTQPWIVAFWHHPPYSKGSHDSDTETQLRQMRENAVPILEAGGVDLVLTGHSHSYERSFFLDGHYDLSSTFLPSMKKDAGDGRADGSGAYEKTGGGPVANEGAVYVVAGSSGQVDSGTLNHPAMYISLVELGSLVIDVDGPQMDVKFLDDTSSVLDYFTIVKNEPVTCGNGVVDAGEQCDDANANNTDACLDNCMDATCGDGFTRSGVEQCDDANASNTDACLDSCMDATCGDGFTRAGVEQCDDANASNTDACLDSCMDATCGDGFTRAGVEQCDDANASNTDACLDSCMDAACGDGFVRTGVEQCDDANGSNTDACLNSCTDATCGDGFTRAGVEQCDDGNANDGDGCLTSCILPGCGDGFVNAGIEQCDDGNDDDTDACLSTCQDAACGDGFVRAGVEQCDDANGIDTDACLDDCTNASCGDGFVRSGVEQCDDGDADDTDACPGNCMNATCGDGFVQAGVEQCDDGNGADDDACPTTCQDAFCGDGFVRPATEECDDGNAGSGDGCSAGCVVDCPAQPRGDCLAAGKSVVKIAYGTKSLVKWKWMRGPAIDAATIGDPTATAGYNLCFYPDVPGAGSLGAQVLLPAGADWLDYAERGFVYRDETGSSGGVTDLAIGTGPVRKTKLKLRALGTGVPPGLLPATSYTIQLADMENGGCWSSAFATGTSSDSTFKARAVAP